MPSCFGMFEASSREARRGRETGLAGAAGWRLVKRLAKQQARLGYGGRIGDSVEVYGYCVQIGRMAGRG